MRTSIARAATDAWVDSSRPALNIGQNKYLRIQDGSPTKYAFWHAKLPPRGAIISTAELHFFGVGSSGATYQLAAQPVAASWKESLIDYANQPGVTGTVATVTDTQSADAHEWIVDVAAQVQTMCNGAPNYGFRLSTTDTTEHRFYSYNALDNQPFLRTEWSSVPDAPTELSPAGGSAVTVAKPWLLFNFYDLQGDDMAALQVHIKATNSGWTAAGGFASPDFDSGVVSSSDPELDLSTTAFAGLSVSDVKYWTVSVQNEDGNWSPWSDVVHFTRTARGTLTLGSPTGGVVSDITPTCIWSLSGAAQTAFRITVWDDSDPGVILYDTGRRTSTATSFTIPRLNRRGQRIIDDESVTYRLRVRVWDTPLRVGTPGDTSHTEVVTTFVFVEDPTPNPPTSVAVAQVNSGQPHVKLDIVIAVAPDAFTIQRNGKFIDADVDPVDIYVSGTTYRYVDRTAPPSTDFVYKVRSKDSGAIGPARTGTPNPFIYAVGEVWLLDWTNPGSNRLVPVKVNLDDCSFEMPENSATYTPIDGHDIVQITQGMKGLRGHILGRIVATAGLTASASVADMLWFKKHPTNQLRMTLGSQNLRVVVKNVLLRPLHIADTDARTVEFDFQSLDGPSQ